MKHISFLTQRLLITVTIFLISVCNLFAAEHPPGYVELIDLPITVRVDTTDADIKAVYDLWRKFLSSNPDSAIDSSLWNQKELKRYGEPYAARSWIYNSQNIIKSFPPLLLSIEKEGKFYAIRTLYYSQGLEDPYKSSNPWALQTVYARKVKIKIKKEDKEKKIDTLPQGKRVAYQSPMPDSLRKKKDPTEYRLFDPLHVITASWRNRRMGPIDYHFPHDYFFDRGEGLRMTKFIKTVRKKYKLPKVSPIEFYITRNQDEIAAAAGLEFILAPSAGRSNTPNAQVFSSLASEWYPHEITHILFREYKPHFILNEGIATFLGGSMNRPFESLAVDLAEFFEINDTITFQQILDSPFLEGSTVTYYTVGAVLCKMAYQQGKAEKVRELLSSGVSDDELYATIKQVLGINKQDVTRAIRQKTKEYADR